MPTVEAPVKLPCQAEVDTERGIVTVHVADLATVRLYEGRHDKVRRRVVSRSAKPWVAMRMDRPASKFGVSPGKMNSLIGTPEASKKTSLAPGPTLSHGWSAVFPGGL